MGSPASTSDMATGTSSVRNVNIVCHCVEILTLLSTGLYEYKYTPYSPLSPCSISTVKSMTSMIYSYMNTYIQYTYDLSQYLYVPGNLRMCSLQKMCTSMSSRQ